MPKITIDIPSEIGKEIPKSKKALTEVFLVGLRHKKAYEALQRLKKLKGVLKKVYPDATSVELQHRIKDLW